MQQTNCHPFRHGRWLWMHNGYDRASFHEVKRDLVLAVDPALYPDIEGSTDSEVLFYLALTFGLERRPAAPPSRARSGFVEEVGRAHGVEHPIQMTVATTDGESVWAFRYSSEGDVAVALLQHRRRDAARSSTRTVRRSCSGSRDEARLVVSEPLGDLRRRVERGARSRATA